MKTIEKKFSCPVVSYLSEQEIHHDYIESVTLFVPDDASQEEIEAISEFQYCVWAVENGSTLNLYDRNPTINMFDVRKEARIRTLLKQVIFRQELPGTAKPDFVRNEHNNIVGAKGFEINADLEVFFAKEHIGHIVVVINDHPEGDDELSCFLPGFVGFQHYPVSNASIACQTIYEKYYSQNKQTKYVTANSAYNY